MWADVFFELQGYCNPFTGVCECRPGFTGLACERRKHVLSHRNSFLHFFLILISFQSISVACHSKAVPRHSNGQVSINPTGTASVIDPDRYTADSTAFPMCSGHGICLTMGEMGNNFDGRCDFCTIILCFYIFNIYIIYIC